VFVLESTLASNYCVGETSSDAIDDLFAFCHGSYVTWGKAVKLAARSYFTDLTSLELHCRTTEQDECSIQRTDTITDPVSRFCWHPKESWTRRDNANAPSTAHANMSGRIQWYHMLENAAVGLAGIHRMVCWYGLMRCSLRASNIQEGIVILSK